MSASRSDPKEFAAQVLAYLRRLKNDRGAMADLRCALNPVKLPRAWPLLGRIGGIGDGIIETVAGLFAYHPDECHSGNLGTTCRQLAELNKSFDARFRRLLACDREEVCYRLRPVILAAKAKDIRVNYEQLLIDLHWWESAKTRWAREYWVALEAEETTPAASAEAMS